MKIAIVHSFYSSDFPSGENDTVLQQAEILRQGGHEVLLVGKHSDSQDYQRIPSLLSAAARVATGLGASPIPYLKDFVPDVVHVHNLFPNFGWRWWSGLSYPLVFTLHNFRLICPAATLYRGDSVCRKCTMGNQVHSVVHSCYKGSSAKTIPIAIQNFRVRKPVLGVDACFIAPSEKLRDEFSGAGFDGLDFHIVPNPLALNPNSAPIKKTGQGWGYFGRLERGKGVDELVEMWPPSEELHVYGSGSSAPDIHCERRPNVHYHGAIPRTEVVEKMLALEGVVVPSRWFESAPTQSFLAAIALGKKVLAREGNTVAQEISEPRHTFGATYTDDSDLGQIIADQRSAKQTGESAVDLYREKFSPEAWLDSVFRVYKHAIATREQRI